MNNMIAIVRPSPRIDPMTRCLMILGSAYGLPICTYRIFDLNTEYCRVPALFFENGSFVEKNIDLPAFSEFQFGRLLEQESEELKNKKHWLQNHTTITDNPALPKETLSKVLLRSTLSVYAIPTYRVSSIAQLQTLCSVIPNALVKPSGGKKGLGVLRIHHRENLLILEDRDGQKYLDETTWKEYLSFLESKHLGYPILQPRLDFSLDEAHAVDFRLLVARGGSGDWETVAIYPRIGASHLVSNVAQGGYIGDATEILHSIAGDTAPQLMAELEQLAYDLPALIQKNCSAPIAALGLDVGIDRDSLRPFILEANSRPATKFHLWQLAEKKIQYYKYLLWQS